MFLKNFHHTSLFCFYIFWFQRPSMQPCNSWSLYGKARSCDSCHIASRSHRWLWSVFGLTSPSVETLAVCVFPAAEMWWEMRPDREEAVKKSRTKGELSAGCCLLSRPHPSLPLWLYWISSFCSFFSLPLTQRGEACIEIFRVQICRTGGRPGVLCDIKMIRCIKRVKRKSWLILDQHPPLSTSVLLWADSCLTENAYIVFLFNNSFNAATTTRQELNPGFYYLPSIVHWISWAVYF